MDFKQITLFHTSSEKKIALLQNFVIIIIWKIFENFQLGQFFELRQLLNGKSFASSCSNALKMTQTLVTDVI